MDPRIARTQGSLQQAALELATERDLDAITVGDIAERAGVNRSSFYQHYSDKETLLADALDAILEEAGASVVGPLDRADLPPDAFTQFIEHVDEHAALYRWALGPHGSAVVTDRLRSRVEGLVRYHMGISGIEAPYEGIPVDIVAAGVAGSGLGAIRAWLEADPRAPLPVATGWLWRMLLGSGGKTS
jgi:AcrR family transcriptional regulator